MRERTKTQKNSNAFYPILQMTSSSPSSTQQVSSILPFSTLGLCLIDGEAELLELKKEEGEDHGKGTRIFQQVSNLYAISPKPFKRELGIRSPQKLSSCSPDGGAEMRNEKAFGKSETLERIPQKPFSVKSSIRGSLNVAQTNLNSSQGKGHGGPKVPFRKNKLEPLKN